MDSEKSSSGGEPGGPRVVPDGGRPRSGREECGNCGNRIDAGTTYCPHCGAHERDRADGGSQGDGDGGDGSRRTANVTRRQSDEDGGGGRDDSSGDGRSSRSTSNYAGSESGRRGHEQRRETDSGGRTDRGGSARGENDRGGGTRGRGESDRERGTRGQGERGRGEGGRDGGGRDAGGRGGGSAGGSGEARGRRSRSSTPGDGSRRDEGGSRGGGSRGGRRMPDDDEAFCASCGEIIPADAAVCPSCGDQRTADAGGSQRGRDAPGGRGGGTGASTSDAEQAGGSDGRGKDGGGATSGSSGGSSTGSRTSLNDPVVNGWRWKVGWRPKTVVLLSIIVGAVVGAMVEYIGEFAFVGLLVGVAVWFWGRGEVNGKYMTLIEDFRDRTRSKVERSTGGMNLSSAHTFIGGSGSSPFLIEPVQKYEASHLLFGDTSVVINRQYHYKMKPRESVQGGKQQEVFYDQIANVQSEEFANYAELQISLSSGQTERIRGRDTNGINAVKRDLQQKMREARR